MYFGAALTGIVCFFATIAIVVICLYAQTLKTKEPVRDHEIPTLFVGTIILALIIGIFSYRSALTTALPEEVITVTSTLPHFDPEAGYKQDGVVIQCKEWSGENFLITRNLYDPEDIWVGMTLKVKRTDERIWQVRSAQNY